MKGDRRPSEIDRLLRQARKAEPAAPPFRGVWAAATADSASAGGFTAGRRWAAGAAAVALGIALLAVGLLWVLRPANHPLSLPESASIEALAASLSRVETPLDSLLEVPGRELYDTLPSLAPASGELPADWIESLEDS